MIHSIKTYNTDKFNAGQEIHRSQNDKLEFPINNLSNKSSKWKDVHLLPIIIDDFNNFSVGSDGGKSINHFRVFTIDGNNEFSIHFIDSQAQIEIVQEEVDSNWEEDNKEQKVEIACKDDVDIDNSNNIWQIKLKIC